MRISAEQQDIISARKDTVVIANPGTGKTTTLSLKVIKLLDEGTNPEDILCITFTEKAKKEMFGAIYKMGKERSFLDADIMKINIHTFHSFAYNYLRDHGEISGDILGNNFLRFLILNNFEQNKALNYEKEYIISEIMPQTENAIRYIKNFGITPDKIDIKKTEKLLKENFDEGASRYTIEEMEAFLKYFIGAYQEYERSKFEKIDYSDMLLIFLERFHGTRFEHVLVDEMQDMNEIEAKIAKTVAKNLFLVGDAKQAIFGFQGGSVKNFSKFRETCDTKMLLKNWRSTQQILNYAREYFLGKTKDRKQFQKELDSFGSDLIGEIPKVISTNAHIAKALEVIEGNKDKTVGIITRTNRQIIEISKILDASGIKYSSTSSQATTQQARKEIQRYLKGLLSDRIEDKIAGTFTAFSRYTLKEAFGFSQAFKAKKHGELGRIKLEGAELERQDLDRIFASIILPVCVSKGAEWFATAVSVKQEVDEYLTFETPTFDGFFNFIAIGEESHVERRSDTRVTLTTVHKAKGREFDVVAYIPATPKRQVRFIDTIVESILLSFGVDVEDEVEEESLRVDFVAFTRAKEKLIVIADDRAADKYHIESLSCIEVDDSEDKPVAATRPNSGLSEAYSLFVAGRLSDSEKLLKHEEGWLKQHIEDYFRNVDHFSYSSITTDPYDFLTRNIVGIPRHSAGAELGNLVHAAMQKLLTDQARIEDYEGEIRKAAQHALDAINELREEFPGLRVDSTEKYQKILLSSMTDYPEDDVTEFTGKMDAIFKHDKGYLIVDYKTDKNSSNASKHKRQLVVYRRMLSIAEKIPEAQISVRVIFVALRGGINTGKFGRETAKETRGAGNPYRTFERHLQRVLEWKKDPDKFIGELLEKKSEDELYHVISEKLTRS